MSVNDRFFENGNALIIEEVCHTYKVPMFEYQAIVSFCSDQLAHIQIKKAEGEDAVYCEPIMRFTIDESNADLLTYTIFSNQRERFDEESWFVIRKLLWQKREDIEFLKQFQKKRQEALSSWPTIRVQNVVLYHGDASEIIRLLKQTDALTKNGIVLTERHSCNTLIWKNLKDIEMMRRYDWGETHCCWGTSMQNEEIEQHLGKSMETLNKELEKTPKEIVYEMKLDYIFPIENFKEVITPCTE